MRCIGIKDMTKEEARRILRRCALEDSSIDALIAYIGSHFMLDKQLSFNEFKSIIEAISDGEYTAELSETQDKYGRYAVDIVKNQIYTEYWN